LELRNIEPESSDAEGKDNGQDNGREEEEVLRAFVEDWWMLENRETPGSDCHEIKPLPVEKIGGQLRKMEE
jgi:hypothetical protein